MTSTTADRPTRVSTARVGLWDRVKEIWRYRELLVAFSRTELKVKYKNSVLGFVWSMLNPALYLVVYCGGLRAHPADRHPVLPDLPALGHPRVEPLRHVARVGDQLGGRRTRGWSRKVDVPPRDPALAVGRRGTRALLPAGDRARDGAGRSSSATSRGRTCRCSRSRCSRCSSSRPRWGSCSAASTCTCATPQHFVELALLAWFWMTPIVYPYRDRRRRSSATTAGCSAPQPDHRHRAHVPARDLRPGQRRQDGRPASRPSRRSSRRGSTSGGTCGTSAS